MDEVNYRTNNEAVRRLLDDWRAASPLQVGAPYDQDKLAAERTRLVSNLRESGYYRATNDLVSFEVDTTYSSSRLSIDVVVDGSNLKVYHINNIYIYPNSIAGLRDATSVFDTLIYRNTKLAEAPSYGKSIIMHDASSTGAVNYLNLAQEILTRNGAKS